MQVEIAPENNQIEKQSTCANGILKNLEQTIDSIIQKEGYLIYKIYKKLISTNGGNYLGVLHEIDIKGDTKDGEKETNLFVKCINWDEGLPFISKKDIYKTELFAYKELSDIIIELQENANIPLQERFKMVKSYDHNSQEAIILENFARRGYKTYHRMDVVSLQFAEKSIKELAKLHSLSFVLQEKKIMFFNEKIKVLKHPFHFCDNNWQDFVKSMYNLIVKHIDNDIKHQVDNKFYEVTDKYAQYIGDENIHICLCHGDYRPNNIMTKFNNEEVIDVIPVDYQLLHYGCPVFDFLYFIFSCTDRKFRKAYLTHLKDVYHDTMRTFLNHFNINVDSVYPRKMFEEVYKKKLDYGLAFGYLILPFMFASEDDVPDLTKELSEIGFEVNEIYRERLRDIIDDFKEWGFIENVS